MPKQVKSRDFAKYHTNGVMYTVYMEHIRTQVPKKWLVLGFLAGFLSLFLVHFVTADSDGIHKHANFALYVNGEKDEFDNFTYYEEVQACNPVDGVRPQSRVHMHDFVSDVVHVHDDGVTWGHFFANLGYTLGNDILVTNDGVYIPDEDAQLSFIVNGQKTRAISNDLIQNHDTLLINYGSESEDELYERFNSIEKTAHEYNEIEDPGSCAGEGSLSLGQRFLRALGISG